MRLVVQRVTRASVRSDGELLGEIGHGAVVLAGIGGADTTDVVDRMADKLIGLRYFPDADRRTNRSITDVYGSLLVISQFTLYADVRRGRRPGFADAAQPDLAIPLLGRFADRLGAAGIPVETGRFGTEMAVELINDGPFTLALDSERDLG